MTPNGLPGLLRSGLRERAMTMQAEPKTRQRILAQQLRRRCGARACLHADRISAHAVDRQARVAATGRGKTPSPRAHRRDRVQSLHAHAACRRFRSRANGRAAGPGLWQRDRGHRMALAVAPRLGALGSAAGQSLGARRDFKAGSCESRGARAGRRQRLARSHKIPVEMFKNTNAQRSLCATTVVIWRAISANYSRR